MGNRLKPVAVVRHSLQHASACFPYQASNSFDARTGARTDAHAAMHTTLFRELMGKGVMGMDDGLSDLADLSDLSQLTSWLMLDQAGATSPTVRLADVSHSRFTRQPDCCRPQMAA